MLRCTVAGLMPLMNSKKYAALTDVFYKDNSGLFEGIVKHESYYLLRELPRELSKALLFPDLTGITARQNKNGLWNRKDSERYSYGILSALKYTGLMEVAHLSYSPLAQVLDQYDEYSLLIKLILHSEEDVHDRKAMLELRQGIQKRQAENGSWGETVTGTVIHMQRLLRLNMPIDDPAIQRGIVYLLSQCKATMQGMHTKEPFGLAVANVFTTEDRDAEFAAAEAFNPEWLPRHACFHTMAVIPNAVCLNLLVRLGLENDPGVGAALDSLYELYKQHGGLCASNIKKPYLNRNQGFVQDRLRKGI